MIVRAVEPTVSAASRLGAGGSVRSAAGSDAVQTFVLTGEFDLTNVDALEAAISDAIDAGARDFVVDLSGVSFLDAGTFNALVLARKRAARRNGEFVLVRPPALVWRIFVLTGLAALFPTFALLDAALRYFSSARN